MQKKETKKRTSDPQNQSQPTNNSPKSSAQNSNNSSSNPAETNNSHYTEQHMQDMGISELVHVAKQLGIIGASLLTKEKLINAILDYQKRPDEEIFVEGVLEKLPDGFGFLRFPAYDYISGPDDIYVSPSQIRRFNLKTGDTITGSIRKPKEGEKYFALLKVDKVNSEDPSHTLNRLYFDRLTPLHPDVRFNLEYRPDFIATRIMNIFTPIGKGQRGLIVAPPKAGKTMLLKEIAQTLIGQNPDLYVIMLLIDERPEEVADMKRTVKGKNAEVISSTFDESPERHVQVAELVLEKAKRYVEYSKDVVIILDSITRLARAYNAIAPASGKVLTGGVDANALQLPKRFFGAARKTEEKGSLTIIASALVETGSRMDEVIFEEFKGTGNMELHLTRKLANRRTYPAFDLMASSTRRDDLLLSEEELNQAWVLHKFLSTMNIIEGMEFIISQVHKHKTNAEFFDSMNSKKYTGAGNGNNNGGNGGPNNGSHSNGNGHHNY